MSAGSTTKERRNRFRSFGTNVYENRQQSSPTVIFKFILIMEEA